jgi:hypothetical protein
VRLAQVHGGSAEARKRVRRERHPVAHNQLGPEQSVQKCALGPVR